VWALHKVDVYTGESELFERGGRNTAMWTTNNGVPVLRWDSNPRGTVYTLHARAPGQSDWTQVRRIRRDDVQGLEFEFIAVTDDPETVLAIGRTEADQNRVVRRFNLRTLQAGDVVAAEPGHDIDAIRLDPHGRFMGVRYRTDRVAYRFTDEGLNQQFEAIDTALRHESNLRLVDMTNDQSRWIMYVTGPRQAGAYYLYDRQARRFEELGPVKPWLLPVRLAQADLLDVRTRDGQTIRAYLTKPLAPGPRPLIVMPHGGPELRDYQDFDVFAQMLAAHGWMVLQPNFRGSGGYGRAFADAGRRHWGDRMQEDVEDAVAHVRGLGVVQGDKIAILGASYGGFAAMLGAIRQPDLYKAVVSIAGPSDLVEMMNWERREEGDDSPAYQYWLRQIGDPRTDAEALAAVSPARHAEALTAPVMLIHGREDRIVPPQQSRIMQQALRRAGREAEMLELENADHSGWGPYTQGRVFSAVVTFLATALA
jgi:dipeptidyl aminopeptidase/acylaminoacyl peptidase